jgi:uncharacterized tellurite resistance protein B-like protein
MSSKLSEAQDAFFQAFAAMPSNARIHFANKAWDIVYSDPDVDETAVALAVHELLALSNAIQEET